MTAATIIDTPKKAAKKQVKLGPKVDQLGALNAQISALTKEADVLKATLKESGLPEIEGKIYRAVISQSSRSTLVADRVKAILTAEQVRACTQTTPTTSLTLYGL